MSGLLMRRRRRSGAIEPNLAALIDILTSTVGVLLVVVLLALLEARGSKVSFRLPLVKEPPEGADRKILLCQQGRLRLFDIDHAIEQAFPSELTFDNIAAMTRRANAKDITDGFFDYAFSYGEASDGWQIQRWPTLSVTERADAPGYDLEQLEKDPESFRLWISDMARDSIWIAFAIDEGSLDLFREARTICAEVGIPVGWDPVTLRFPYEINLASGGGGILDIVQ